MARQSEVFREAARRAAKAGYGRPDRQVSAGIFTLWGSDLDWPAWMFSNTSIPAARSLPHAISAADDLTMLANFLDHIGPERLLKTVANPKRHYHPPDTLARLQSAPNVKSLIEMEARRLELNNDQLSVAVTVDRDQLEVAISVDPSFGILGEFQEYGFLVYLLRTVQMVEPPSVISERSNSIEVSLKGDRPGWRRALGVDQDYDVHAGSKTTGFRTALDWCLAANPTDDLAVWSGAEKWIAAAEQRVREGLSLDHLEEIVTATLKMEHRVLRFNEIAAKEGISERTLARKLSQTGLSYRSLVDRVRSNLAKELMADPDRSTGQVARELGFSHSSSFARAFREWFGCSPSQWRSRA